MSPPTLAETYGCGLIAHILNMVLYGIVMLLVGQYFIIHRKRDPKYLQAIVIFLFITSTAEAISLGDSTYQSFVKSFGNVAALDKIELSAIVSLICTYQIAFTAQIFFITKVWIITKHSVVYIAPMVALVLLQISAGIVQTVSVFRLRSWILVLSNVKIAATQSLATAACDITITATLCYVLHDSRSGVKRTDSVIDKLIIYAINRGAVTSLAALLNSILLITFPQKFYFLIPLVASGNLYAISVISTLCTRQTLRNELNTTINTFSDFQLPSRPVGQDMSSAFSRRKIAPNDDHVHVQTSVITWEDSQSNVLDHQV